jgi:carbon-monoxide dehydrogenase medium subunit
MKPAAFGYHRARSVSDAIGLLTSLGDDAKLIAGGQSLVAMMNFRLARPEHLVDITRISGLGQIQLVGGSLRLGALVTHHRVERLTDEELGPGHHLLRGAMRYVGHLPIRTRGTVGGSLAHGDATAEWALMAVLFNATIVAEGPRGRRELPADDFFFGLYATALEPEELIVEIVFRPGFEHGHVLEFAERHGDFAIVAVAVMIDMDKQRPGRVLGARVAVAGTGPTPTRIPEAEQALTGQLATPELARRCGDVAAEAVHPDDAPGVPGQYRRELVRTLVARAVEGSY